MADELTYFVLDDRATGFQYPSFGQIALSDRP